MMNPNFQETRSPLTDFNRDTTQSPRRASPRVASASKCQAPCYKTPPRRSESQIMTPSPNRHSTSVETVSSFKRVLRSASARGINVLNSCENGRKVTCAPPKVPRAPPVPRKLTVKEKEKAQRLEVVRQYYRGYANILLRPRESLLPNATAVGDCFPNAINHASHAIFSNVFDPEASVGFSMLDQPCVSARLFACFMLSRPLDAMNRLVNPVLSLMKAMVRAEVNALQSVNVARSNGVPPYMARRHIRVQFSSFDGSCNVAPLDGHVDAACEWRESVFSMVSVMDEIKALSLHAIPCLQSMVTFFQSMLELNDGGPSVLLEACSAAIGFPWQRLAALIQAHCNDFAILERRLRSALYMPTDAIETLSAEKLLAEKIGLAVRFQLRLLLNEVKSRCLATYTYQATEDTVKVVCTEQSTECSQISALLTLTMPNGASNLAVRDECFSALVSTALFRLHECFGMTHLLTTDVLETFDTSISFYASSLYEPSPSSTVKEILEEINTSTLTAGDVGAILRDIDEAVSFLALAGAAQFLVDFFSIPGVSDEIQRMAGWSQFEEYMSLIERCELWPLCSGEAHLVGLLDLPTTLQRLQSFRAAMAQSMILCQSVLDKVRQKYGRYFVVKDGTREQTNARILMAAYNNPQIVKIWVACRDGLQRLLPWVSTT